MEMMKAFTVAFLVASVLVQSEVAFAGLAKDHDKASDCMHALFDKAGVRSSHVDQYVEAFRKNGLDQTVLFDLSFLDLVKFLQRDTFKISHAGDVFNVYKCLADRGLCVVEPFCRNGGGCVYDNVKRQHLCKCTPKFEGSTCTKPVQDRVGKVEQAVVKLSHVVSHLGVSYTRWGKNSCNSETRSALVYNGYMASGYHASSGSGANYICLPFHPEFDKYQPGDQDPGLLYGAEFETSGSFAPFNKLHNQNPTCSVCHVQGRGSQIMIPGKKSCPSSWALEYHGYLMSTHHSHQRSEFVCVDGNPDVVRGEAKNTEGANLYFVQTQCGHGIDCPPYDNNRELTCAVCTR